MREQAAPSAKERLDLAEKRLASIEEREGGRLGAAVIDTETGWTHRPQARPSEMIGQRRRPGVEGRVAGEFGVKLAQ